MSPTRSLLVLALLFGSVMIADPAHATETIETPRDLERLARKARIDGSVVIAVPGLTSVELPRLTEITGRLDVRMPGVVRVDLPRLERVGADLFVGCDAPARQEWTTLGPIRPLEALQTEAANPFAAGPEGRSSEARRTAGTPGLVDAPRLLRVGGGLSVCSPGLTGLSAPQLSDVGTDLQFYAGASWTRVALGGLRRVGAGVFGFLDGAALTVELGALTTVDGALQISGHGDLRVALGALATAAAVAVSGSRRTASGIDASVPSLVVAELSLPALARASQLLTVRTIGGLMALSLPSLTETASIVLADLPDLSTIAAEVLPSTSGDLVLDQLPALTTLSLPALTAVDGDLVLRALGSAVLDGPPVARIGGALRLQDMTSVRAIQLRALRWAGAVLASNLGRIELLSLPALEEVAGGVIIDGQQTAIDPTDTTLRLLNLGRLRHVHGADGLRILDASFSDVRLDALADSEGPVELLRLGALGTVQLASLTAVTGVLRIAGAPRVTVIELPALARSAGIELDAMLGLKRLSARRSAAPVRQRDGTRVSVVETAP